jgi:type II secretory pathway component GspD/PulD (secretin)
MPARFLSAYLTSAALLAGFVGQAAAQTPCPLAGRHAKGKLVTKTYQVVDLVVPVDSGATPCSISLNGRTERTPTEDRPCVKDNHPAPGITIEDKLIQTITSTVAPRSWQVMGGRGTIEYFPLGMALVVNQTPEVHEQIAELLAALRRLQEMEVAVEVRFVTVSESCYKGLGLDCDDANGTLQLTPEPVSGHSQEPGAINSFRPNDFVTGVTPGPTYSADLNVPVTNSSFTSPVPPPAGLRMASSNDGLERYGIVFSGGCPTAQAPVTPAPMAPQPTAPVAAPSANDPLRVTFLNGGQVFALLEAVQGDCNSQVLQAPKVTVFNGQATTVNNQEQQFFVTAVKLFNSHGQVVCSPENNPFTTGLKLSLQPVISADRRFVRLDLDANLTKLESDAVPLFPVTTFITPVFEGGVQGKPLPFTQYIQLPKFTKVAVHKMLSIPDGGTAVLSGWKTVHDVRDAYGPPILSRIPYVNRLFKNVGYGPQTEYHLVLVTPKVIVNEEEEVKRAGYTCPYLKQQEAEKASPAPEPEKCTVLENIDKLEQATKDYRRAEHYRRDGQTARAVHAYEKVQRLCPHSRFAELAARRLSALQAGEATEEQEAPAVQAKVAKLLDRYRRACADGRLDEAKELAHRALALDPACFSKGQDAGDKDAPCDEAR